MKVKAWLEKVADAMDIFSNAHLSVPLPNKPIELGYSTKFYPDYFIHRKIKFDYSQITGIFSQMGGTRLNGSLVQEVFTFKINIKSELLRNGKEVVDLSVSTFLFLNTRRRAKAIVCSNWLLDKTGIAGRRFV